MRIIMNAREMVVTKESLENMIATYTQTMQITLLEPGEIEIKKTDRPVMIAYEPNLHPLKTAMRRERRLLFDSQTEPEVDRFKLVISNEAVVDVSGHLEVEASDKAVVNSYGHTKITARGNARVRATVDDVVEAYDNVAVVAKSNAVVSLHDKATAKLSQNARLVSA